MGYSDEELNIMSDPFESDIAIWNAGSVYFDDEVVEYQGKFYKALRKTSAEIPGRSKAGTWMELHDLDDNKSSYGSDEGLYEDEIIPTDMSSMHKKASAAVTPKKAVVDESKKTPIKKKTLKEKQEENKTREMTQAKTSPSEKRMQEEPVQKSSALPSERKMTLAPNDQSLVNDILKEMDFKKIKGVNSDDHNIKSNLILPQSVTSPLNDEEKISLNWESSHPDIISTVGKVQRPVDGNDVAVNLSLSVTKNKATSTRFFTLWVKSEEKVYTDQECVDMVYNALSFDHFKGQNSSVQAVSYSLDLLTHGLHDTKIFWASSHRDLIDETGYLHKDKVIDNIELSLYAIIVKNKIERMKRFELQLKL